MSRNKKTIINGVELPEDFRVSSIINNIVISNDGRYAAVTKAGDVLIAQIPENGRIEVDGTTMSYHKGTGRIGLNTHGSNIRMSSFSGGSVFVSGRGSDLEHEIDQTYENVSRVSLREKANDINLGLSQDRSVHVKGLTSAAPEYTGSRLAIQGLEGKLLLPKSIVDLEHDMKTMSGDINGYVAHSGRLKTMSGDISILLTAPLIVHTNTMSGDIDVRGMMADGRARYTPPGANPIGNLHLETMSGDIDVKYRAE